MPGSGLPPQLLLLTFLVLRFGQLLLESALGRLNHRYALDPKRQAEASEALRLSSEDMRKATAYAADRYRFGVVTSWAGTLLGLSFLGLGGVGWTEGWAEALVPVSGHAAELAVGLALLGLLGLGAALLQLPFAFFRTFRIEAKHGFNRQSVAGFFGDWAKGLALAIVLGAPLLLVLLLLIERAGRGWWLWAWAALFAFSALTAWIFPTLIVPIFNRLEPIPAGPLQDGIRELTGRAGFSTRGVFSMDASRRTTHGNAFFAGLSGSRRIVLFDTLIEALTTSQVVAVLAHELGHFKLHHVRWQLVRSTLITGLLLWLMSLCLAEPVWYLAFGFRGPTAYGALVVFGLWFELLGFLLQPVESALSRRQERDADLFAVRHGVAPEELKQALLALRERSHTLPLSHPLYSRFYHLHPPLLERIQSLSARGRCFLGGSCRGPGGDGLPLSRSARSLGREDGCASERGDCGRSVPGAQVVEVGLELVAALAGQAVDADADAEHALEIGDGVARHLAPAANRLPLTGERELEAQRCPERRWRLGSHQHPGHRQVLCLAEPHLLARLEPDPEPHGQASFSAWSHLQKPGGHLLEHEARLAQGEHGAVPAGHLAPSRCQLRGRGEDQQLGPG